jgi:6-phosphogluconolactonase
VLSYRLEKGDGGALRVNDPPFVKVKGGSGPRHFAFHPRGEFGYLLNEMGSRVTVFSYDRAKGELKELQNISTLPDNFQGEDNSAEIEVDRTGRFLYASNRGDDSITVFSIDQKNGKLTTVQRTPTQGKIPRNFKIDPSGQYLFAANQNSNNIVVLKIHDRTGKLSPTGRVLDVPSPVCLLFVPALDR